MRNSYFKGWSSTLPSVPQTNLPQQGREVFIGHVLSVDFGLGEGADTTKYPGRIIVKLIGVDQKPDDAITREAYPVDLNIIKYPLPGEIVYLFEGYESSTYKDRIVRRFYYTQVISANNSATFNSNPYYSTTETQKTIFNLTQNDYVTRFEKKISSISSFKNTVDNTIKERRMMQPYEGDFILQSRFGSAIRFGSTGLSTNNNALNTWSKIGGVAGNPITILSVDRASSKGALAEEDINKDDASLYLCSSQVVPILLSTSKDLKTYRFIYDVAAGDAISPSPDRTSFIETPDDEFRYYNDNPTPTDIIDIPNVDTTELKKILDSISDDLLDPVIKGGPLTDNRNKPLDLVFVDGYLLERNTAKAALALKKAAKNAGINLVISSGYRVQFGAGNEVVTKAGRVVRGGSQEKIRRDTSYWITSERNKYASENDYVFQAPSNAFNPQVAVPGSSRHGDGIAVDFKVGSRKSTRFPPLDSAVYTFLIKNAHKFGFVRTVSTEEWHYEFRPDLAAKGPYGGIGLALKDPASRHKYLFYSDLQLDKLT